MSIHKPFVFLFKTRLQNYAYDVNTNTILRINEAAYQFLNTRQQFKMEELQQDKALQPYLLNLLENGYLSSQRPQIMQHPKTKHIEHMLRYQLKTLTLQVTQKCNLRCSYCVYSGNYENRGHGNLSMDVTTAKKCIDFVLKRSVDSDRLDFGFYGGEPLLNFALIKKCVEYVNSTVIGRDTGFHMTTNGTLFTDEILEFLNRHKFSLTISLDGDRESHDKNRRFAANNGGTFDTIIKNVNKIKNNYPELFKTINFNVVMDTKNDFGCVNDFFTSYETFKDMDSVRSSYLNDAYAKDEITYQNDFIRKRGYEVFKMMAAKLGKLDDRHVSKLIRDYYVQIYFRMFHYRKPSKGMPLEAHHGGPCVPGIQRLFSDINGNLYPCERVSENSEVVRIGHVDSGFDLKKIDQILNIGKLTEDACKNCWNIRFCTLCAAVADNLTGFSREMKLKHCHFVKHDIQHTLLDFCMFNEQGYDFSEGTIMDFENL